MAADAEIVSALVMREVPVHKGRIEMSVVRRVSIMVVRISVMMIMMVVMISHCMGIVYARSHSR